MQFLFLGAGAIGTYVGGSLAAAGHRVTFIEQPAAAVGVGRDAVAAGQDVAILTVDTYRVAAVEQLRAWAAIRRLAASLGRRFALWREDRLMLRAGMIRKLASGLYTWSPLGLKVLKKVEAIVREEMDRAGALEVVMPTVQPRELWDETGRWQKFGPQLLKIKDRKDAGYCYGPTHEEVVTDFARNELKSYKQLPINFYQIQTKFRDEIRPRFGIMRAREFLMKDAYSFHADAESLATEYRNMYDTYSRIFTRCGLDFRTDPLSRFPLLTIPDSPFPIPGLSACAIAPGTGNVGDCVVTTRGDHDAFLARQTARQDS